MSVLDRFSPKTTNFRDPRDPKKRNGMFINWPRYLKFGGARGTGLAQDQSGDTKPDLTSAKGGGGGGQHAVGPISDRGKGR